MGQQQLNYLLLKHLRNINRTSKKINYTTTFKSILRNDDGRGGLSTSALYQLLVTNSIKGNHKNLIKWPMDWLEMNVSDLTRSIA
jgi:hypothetical protein